MKPDPDIFKTMPAGAEKVHLEIEKILEKLQDIETDSPLNPSFLEFYNEFLSLFDSYLYEFIQGVNAPVSCSKGCAHCCNHWVEDVYSFEAEIIADYVKKNQPENIDPILEACFSDIEQYNLIDELVNEKIGQNAECKELDPVDLILTCFYQMNRPCPFLNERGECSIYSVRPLTCRKFINLSHPSLCRPENIDEEITATCLLDIKDDSVLILEDLHQKFSRYGNDTGLRSLIRKYLEK